MNYSLYADVKKVITGESHDLVDPYVEVTFAGMTVSKSHKVIIISTTRSLYNLAFFLFCILFSMCNPMVRLLESSCTQAASPLLVW